MVYIPIYHENEKNSQDLFLLCGCITFFWCPRGCGFPPPIAQALGDDVKHREK
jgi:hypothetical protein